VCISLLMLAAGGSGVAAEVSSVTLSGQTLAPTHYTDWPAIKPQTPVDAKLEARARAIVAQMSLAQKIGQMTQAEIKSITPAEVKQFYIGSVLNGGGSWPHGNKHASVADWLA
jgi:beta-glucosidase